MNTDKENRFNDCFLPSEFFLPSICGICGFPLRRNLRFAFLV